MVVVPEADPLTRRQRTLPVRLWRKSVYIGSPPETVALSAEKPYMFYTYILKSKTYGTRYVGSAEDIAKRLKEHNNGKVRYTKGRMPWLVIYKEEFQTRSEAIRREKFLKTGQGRKFLDIILSKDK
jgi:putative endonuclease